VSFYSGPVCCKPKNRMFSEPDALLTAVALAPTLNSV
jgi:hypothetical protein